MTKFSGGCACGAMRTEIDGKLLKKMNFVPDKLVTDAHLFIVWDPAAQARDLYRRREKSRRLFIAALEAGRADVFVVGTGSDHAVGGQSFSIERRSLFSAANLQMSQGARAVAAAAPVFATTGGSHADVYVVTQLD